MSSAQSDAKERAETGLNRTITNGLLSYSSSLPTPDKLLPSNTSIPLALRLVALMEDPWAAGPSWTSPKPEQLDEAEQRGGIPASFTPPPPSFDVSDLWGVQPTPARLPGEEAVNRAAAREEDEDEGGWGGGEATAGWGGMDTGRETETVELPELSGLRIASPPHPEASEDDVQGGWGEPSSPDSPIDEVPQPRELSEAAPASPFRAPSPDLALSHPVVASSPLASPPSFPSDLPSTSIPRSPSFGDDAFGGFSAGVAAGSDPWGADMDAEEGWGGGESSRHGSFDRNMQASQQEEDEGSDEGEGWGGVRAPRIMPQEQVERSDEDDWEEVQRRMRIQEERMVSTIRWKMSKLTCSRERRLKP